MDLFDKFRGSRRTTVILPTDIVVFRAESTSIVGPTRSGKSWVNLTFIMFYASLITRATFQFMSMLLQSANVQVPVSKRLTPGTTEVHAERCRFEGMQSDIVIVDTPPFCTYMELDGEEVMREWMESNYTGRCKAVMMVYMHNFACDAEDANLRLSNHLGVFRRACRQNLFPSVIHVVPTLSFGENLSAKRLRTLTTQLQRQANAEGAQLANGRRLFDGKPETTWGIIQGLLNKTTSCSSNLSRGSEKAMSISSRRQENDGSAQAKKPEVEANDYVIFVVGPRGAGKTRLTRQLSKSRYVAQGGHLLTTNVEAWRCNLDDGPANTVVIDTPSFHTGRDNVDADDTIADWLKSNFTEKCHPGILFLHSLDSDPTCGDMLISRHLEGFAKAFPNKFKIPSRVYVVPTSSSNSTLPSEKLGQRLLQLNTMTEALNGHGNCKWHASMFPGVFNGQRETARSAALLLIRDISQTQAKKSVFFLNEPTLKCLVPQFLDLANLLFKEFRKDPRNGDLDAIITFGRTSMELTPPKHPQRHSALINLADLLSERFDKEGTKEDLDEVITLRRDALECLSPNDPQRLATHLDLDKSLSQRFRSRGALVDLEEIISLRRVESESTPAPDRYKPLLSLADFLHEKYRILGSVDDIEEAIRLVHTASQLCILLAILEQRLAKALLGTDPSSFGSSIIERLIEKVVLETLENMPPRLLHTQSGELCNRDAQLSKFKNSPQYKRLLSRKSSRNNQQLEAEIKAVVSEYFAFATLSHRWGSGEPLLCDVEGKNIYDLCPTHGLEKHSLEKLQTFCVHALERNFQWAWSDTCCINKDSSAELQEAIGSMFTWYHRSSLTIVYLADIGCTGSLAGSTWFKRGWTLQELLASNTILFYARDWSLYVTGNVANHKTDPALLEELCKATQIPDRYLINFNPGMEDARSRLCWASCRRTTRPEDMAYSLFGIFKVQLPVLYGETAEDALGRLLAEIISRSGDVSVLDWVGEQSSFNSCFPANLKPYQTIPHIQLVLGSPVPRKHLELEKARNLYDALAKLPLAQCVHRRIMLPAIIYPVTAVPVKVSSARLSHHIYWILASGLTPLEVTSSVDLDEGSDEYILVRPWHPQSLQMQTGSDDDETGSDDYLSGSDLVKLLRDGVKTWSSSALTTKTRSNRDVTGGDDAIWSLVDQLGQPFHALLLKRLLHNRYRRIACDTITACVQDPASILDSKVLTLEVV
ncbi:hypothetical protein EDD15DRAFT_2412538 [Pisolithus albus]|nr:hypothetical protein EDD15DRAFT_2412538 [Pisolithus albus]